MSRPHKIPSNPRTRRFAGDHAVEGIHVAASHLPGRCRGSSRVREGCGTPRHRRRQEARRGVTRCELPLGHQGDPRSGPGGQAGLRDSRGRAVQARHGGPGGARRGCLRRHLHQGRSLRVHDARPGHRRHAGGRPGREGLPARRFRRGLGLRRRAPDRLRQPARAARHRPPLRLRRGHARHRDQGRDPAVRPCVARGVRGVRAAGPRGRSARRSRGQRQDGGPRHADPHRDGHRGRARGGLRGGDRNTGRIRPRLVAAFRAEMDRHAREHAATPAAS